ncbi:MAG: protein TolQ [Burkholderiales bacterium]|nr:protein TolQ [Burkholderiales bacterium]
MIQLRQIIISRDLASMEQMSILSLILNASLTVQVIMLILALFSISSWGIIINKFLMLSRAKSETRAFNQKYQNTANVTTLYNNISTIKRTTTAQMFFVGISEYNILNKKGVKNKDDITANLERSLTATIEDELSSYESGLATLATFGSVSPYVGLLGTVWGIMHAFIGLGNTGQATLASVAPGIAEALIATAIGLFVAIPAYMAYNKFSEDIAMLEKKMNKFGDEFINSINRHLASNSSQDY